MQISLIYRQLTLSLGRLTSKVGYQPKVGGKPDNFILKNGEWYGLISLLVTLYT